MRHPALIALAVAVFGIAAMLLVDHGPWSKAKMQPAHVALYRTTGEAARAAGAAVLPTAPRLQIEPDAAAPKMSSQLNPVMP